MEALSEESRVIVISLQHAQLVIGKPYLCKKHLAWLFEIEDAESVVLLDPEAEEVDYDEAGHFQCDVTKHYTIVTEADIDEEEDPHFTEAQCHEHIARVDERRRTFIQQHWTPKHDWLYAAHPDVLHENLESNVSAISKEIYKGENCFKEAFLADFLTEVLAMEKSGLPLQQPNTMNRYGIIFYDFGLSSLFNTIYQHFHPIVEKILPNVDFPIYSNHAFLVQYKAHQQKDLGLHVDDSSFTINLCLENTSGEGELFFQENFANPELKVKNVRGNAILHYGNHMHGAYPVNKGERYNLIIWYRGTKYQ